MSARPLMRSCSISRRRTAFAFCGLASAIDALELVGGGGEIGRGLLSTLVEASEGLTADRLRVEVAWPSRPARVGSHGAGWARPGPSLAVTDEVLEVGLERLRRAPA